MVTVRTLSCVVLVMASLVPGCTKPPQALAVERLFDEVPALREEGYSYVRTEELAGGFVVILQQSEVAATSETTPVFWVGDGQAYLVNEKAQALAPDMDVAPDIVFDLLDPGLFPDFCRGAFEKPLRQPSENLDMGVSIDSV